MSASVRLPFRSPSVFVTSDTPACDECGELAQLISAPSEWRQRAIGGLTQLARQQARTIDAAEGNEGRLLHVYTNGFAGLGGIAFDIEQIVDDLKGESEILGKCRQCGDHVGIRRSSDGTGRRGGAEERAGFATVDPLQGLEADLLIGCEQIECLSADQAVNTNRLREEPIEPAGQRGLVLTRDCS